MYQQPWLLVQNRFRGKGGRELDKFRGIEPPVDDDFGSEAWVGSVTKMVNPVKDEPNYGCSEMIMPDGSKRFLFEVIAENPEQILGKAHMDKNGTDLGMLVKYLDTRASFSLQCHPTRSWAKEMWGSDYGKEESWHVISTREDSEEPAYVILGFKEGVSRELWEKYYFADDIPALENLCHKIQIKPGDTYFVECGCPHKVGPGCFLIEVQEPSDLTSMAFRIDEYARRVKMDRPYTQEEEEFYDKRLLGTYIYEGCSYEENLRRRQVTSKIFRKGDWGEEKVVVGPGQTELFSFTELTVHGTADIRNTGYPQVVIVMDGEGKLTFDGGEMKVKKGDELFFPYQIPNHKIQGNVKLILCHPEGVTYEFEN